ncbi:hypothetical protein MMC30_001807 [Trapelia coarctata]|nr:hypothetical protein [Trapelia coarctata]
MSTPTPAPAPLDLKSIQGDILAGLPKKTQTYFFFTIDDARVPEFRRQLAKLVPLITTTAQVADDRQKIAQKKKEDPRNGDHDDKNDKHDEHGDARRTFKISGVNLAFTQKGLTKMGINDDINDPAFKAGMLADAVNLGDQGTTTGGVFSPDWIPAFKQNIHGMFLVSGNRHETVEEKLEDIGEIFSLKSHNATIHEVIRIIGDVRPGKEKGHEHFGFLDGISQPAVAGFDTKPNPGQESVRQGIVLIGREGDNDLNNVPIPRPSWALDGSLLSFRYLFQLVPEFDTFLKQNPIPVGIPPDQGSELLGARLVGRWKSGAPIDVVPTKDDPKLGVDPSRNNDFRYDFPHDFETQDRCPFAAHTRKTNPRNDLEQLKISTEPRRIIRRGIQFGPEVTEDEAKSGKTTKGRGLIFAAYSSNIVHGFQFIQQSWANNEKFPPKAGATVVPPVPKPGFDPIIGQAANPSSRTLVGTNPQSQSKELTLNTQWVVPKGGEYFFTPSIKALKETFALEK